MSAASSLALPLAWIIRRAFDKWIPDGNYRLLLYGGIALLGLRILNALLTVLTRNINVVATESMTRKLREHLAARLFQVSRREYDGSKQGELHDLVVTESVRFHTMCNYLVGAVFPAVVRVLALTAVLGYLSWRLLAVLLVVWPVVWLMNEAVRRVLVTRIQRYNTASRNLSMAVLERVRLLNLIRFENQELKEEEVTRERIVETGDTARPVQLLDTVYLEFQSVVLTVISVAVLVVGGRQVAVGAMSLGDFISFYMVVGILNQALRDFAQGVYHVFVGWESLEQIVLWLNRVDLDVYQGQRKLVPERELVMREVSFGYTREHGLLAGVNLTLARGETIVLLGPNGCGKSTILWLLLGMYKPDEGELLADGVSYHELDIGELRRQIGMAPQNAVLLDGTIRENISYSKEGAGEEEILEALAMSGSKEWVRHLPEGLDTRVGPDGALLSGGQRQRLSLARALLKKPPFLFLDEPTNHLDERSVMRFLSRIKQLDPAPGILIITHDNSLKSVADRVYEMNESGLQSMEQLSPGEVLTKS